MKAAKLRAEVAELEKEQEEARRKERQALFQILDTDSDGDLNPKELQKGVKDVMGVEVDDETAERLVKALDVNGDGRLQPEELDFEAVQRLLKEFRKEMQSIEEAEKTQAYLNKEEEMLRKEWDQFLTNRPPRNEDKGLLTRLGSLAAYLLPLTDALRFGVSEGGDALHVSRHLAVIGVKAIIPHPMSWKHCGMVTSAEATVVHLLPQSGAEMSVNYSKA
ncbi:unnamed protein product [Effrenium voratum]|uniref:EF-hand domain-containing protein n=1 Tax=Effrenium voratum TaxID=2562239 RepID=A0AA36MZH6_9DINO|nr:unnamed protein product [Effrenium voratum]CAJ1435267.1 unnamed protein product [Effrenium voratum]